MIGPNEFRWDDLRFPAQGINPPGGAADPSWDEDDVGWAFAGNQDNILGGNAQLPHDWLVGVPLRPHIHVFPKVTSSGKSTVWKLEYKIYTKDEAIPAAFTAETITESTIATRTAQIYSFSHIPVAQGESCIIKWKLSRLASSDANDDFTGIMILDELDFHYARGGFGSVAEFGDYN